MARLRGSTSKSQGNQHARSIARGEVLIGPGVTDIKPEAGRSNPGQDEVALTSDGGPKGCCRTKHSPNLGLVVKGQSRPVTAGSSRNGSKASLTGDR